MIFHSISLSEFFFNMSTFLGVLLVSVITYILYYHYESVRALYFSMKIAGPPALPIIGNGLMFLNNTSAGNLKRLGKITLEIILEKNNIAFALTV